MAAPVDDPKWRIFCVARIKPVGEGEAAAVVQESATQLSVPHPDDDDEEPTEGRLTFTMDAICGPEATQQDVYALFKPIVASTCKGRNGCVFAYGQTGSGKTHTVVGGDDFRSRGLVPRAIGQVFREAAKRRRKGGDVSVSCTFAQVYDDALYDLLDESNESDDVGEWTKASVLEGDDGSLTFEGLAEYGADEEEDALRLLWVGTARRVLGQTKANDASSRSHAVFTIYVVDAQRKTRAKLHLVDLAGSERFGAWSDGRRGTRARRGLHRLRSRPRSGPCLDEHTSLGALATRGCLVRNARARRARAEATSKRAGPAQEGGCQIPKVITAAVVDSAVVITTDMGAGRTLTDTRSLDEDGAAIKMELELTTPDATIALTRWLVKSEPPKAPASSWRLWVDEYGLAILRHYSSYM